MNNIRRTKPGIAICPFFTWTSEDIERTGHNENDVNLTHCTHKANKHDHEGNCCEPDCPLLESEPEPTDEVDYRGEEEAIDDFRIRMRLFYQLRPKRPEGWVIKRYEDIIDRLTADKDLIFKRMGHEAGRAAKLDVKVEDLTTENKNLKDEIEKAYGRMDSIEQALKDGRG